MIKTTIDVHPAAELFPMMGDDDLRQLAEDIKANGQQESCIIYRGLLLDGRNRWKACELLGIEPETAERDDEPSFDPIAFVISRNLHRRHLTESQRAMVAAKLKKQLEGPAKERRKAKLKRGNEKPVTANLPEREKSNSESREQAAAMLNVSGRTVDHAATVLEKGSKELIAAVEKGEVAVSRAASVAKSTPKREQVAAVEAAAVPAKRSTLDQLKHWWRLADDEDRDAFKLWIE
jgi:ParB-like chromosome segregation protein Spo0J